MKNLKNIIQSTTEPAVNDIWLKDGKLYYFNGKWISISGKSEEDSSEGKIFIIGDINTQTYDFTPSLILDDYEEFKVKSTDASLCVRLVNPELNYNTLATLDVSNDSNTIVFSYAGKYGLLTIYVDDVNSKVKFEYNKNIIKNSIKNSMRINFNKDFELESIYINNNTVPATSEDIKFLFNNFSIDDTEVLVSYFYFNDNVGSFEKKVFNTQFKLINPSGDIIEMTGVFLSTMDVEEPILTTSYILIYLTPEAPMGYFFKNNFKISSPSDSFDKTWKDSKDISTKGNVYNVYTAVTGYLLSLTIPHYDDFYKVKYVYKNPIYKTISNPEFVQAVKESSNNYLIAYFETFKEICLLKRISNTNFVGSCVFHAAYAFNNTNSIIMRIQIHIEQNGNYKITILPDSIDTSPILYLDTKTTDLNANKTTYNQYIQTVLSHANGVAVRLCKTFVSIDTDTGIYGTFVADTITTIEGEYIKYYAFNKETGRISLSHSTYIPDLSSTISLTIGNTQEINALNLEKLNKVSGKHFYTQINYGYGVGTFVSGTGGFAHVTTAYGNDVFYTIGADGSVVKDENYIKPNEPYTVKLNASDVGTELDQIVGSHIVNAGELIVTGSTGPVTYTRTSDSTSSYIYFTDNKKDGKVMLLTYEVNTRRLISSTVVPSKFKNEVSIIHINIPVLENTKIYTPSEVSEMFGLTEGEMYDVLSNKKVLYTTTINDSSGDLNATFVTLISKSVNVQVTQSGIISDLEVNFGSHFFKFKFGEPFAGRETNVLFVDATSGGGGAN